MVMRELKLETTFSWLLLDEEFIVPFGTSKEECKNLRKYYELVSNRIKKSISYKLYGYRIFSTNLYVKDDINDPIKMESFISVRSGENSKLGLNNEDAKFQSKLIELTKHFLPMGAFFEITNLKLLIRLTLGGELSFPLDINKTYGEIFYELVQKTGF